MISTIRDGFIGLILASAKPKSSIGWAADIFNQALMWVQVSLRSYPLVFLTCAVLHCCRNNALLESL